MIERLARAGERENECAVWNVAPDWRRIRHGLSDPVNGGVSSGESNGDALRKPNRDGGELRTDAAIGARVQRDDGATKRRTVSDAYRRRVLKPVSGLGRQGRRFRQGAERVSQQIAARDALCFARAR